MSCGRYGPLISEDLDGRLSPRKKRILERHLERCASCRAYREELVRLKTEASRIFEPDRGPEYWEGFGRRLGARLKTDQIAAPPRPKDFSRRWRWALAGAAVLVVVLAGIRFLSEKGPVPQDRQAFSQEESLAMLLAELEDDPDLARSFSDHVEASLRETAGLDALESPPRFRDDPLFWESLSDEELVKIEQELRTQYGQTEVSYEVH